MNVAIVCVVHNLPGEILDLQMKSFDKYCKEDIDFYVIDNSSDYSMSAMLKNTCGIFPDSPGVYYRRYISSEGDPSLSHAQALEYSLSLINGYDAVMFVDHDLIPFKPFSIEELLNHSLLAGVMQAKSRTYPWPGCMIVRKVFLDKLDFSCNREFELDTGGNNYPLVETYPNMIEHLSEIHVSNPHAKGFYNFYAVIAGCFMHFINASGWNPSEDNHDRLYSLMQIHHQLTKQTQHAQ